MATFRKVGDKWRAEVAMQGVRRSKVLPTKAAANAWAATTEADILAGKTGSIPNKTFGDLLERYRDEVTPTKRGTRWEEVRIGTYLRDPIAKVALCDLSATHFADWRDRRLTKVKPGSVLREWNILSNACKRAVNEWKWLSEHPMKAVEKPKKPSARMRIGTPDEVARMEQCAGYSKGIRLTTASLRMFAAYLFSIETALRAGEVCALERNEVFIDKGYLKVTGIKPGARKNNAAVRDVPLTPRAVEILEQVMGSHSEPSVFDVSKGSLDALFRKVRDRAMVDDLTYHDSRHAAITWMAQSGKYNVLELARIVGHTNINELMTYFNPTIEQIIKRGAAQETKPRDVTEKLR
jgi:integrase